MNNCLFEEPQNPPNKENCNGSTTQDRNHKTIKIFDKNHRNPMKQLRHVMTLKQQHQPDLVVRNQKVKKKLPSCQKNNAIYTVHKANIITSKPIIGCGVLHSVEF